MTLTVIHYDGGSVSVHAPITSERPYLRRMSEMAYAAGFPNPRYHVPAIRQGFEFGRNLMSGEVVLMHWHQEAV